MKKLIPLVLFTVAGAIASAADSALAPLSTVNYRGTVLPVFAGPQTPSPQKWVEPLYPGWARQAQLEGEVTLTLLVDAEGKVAEVEVLSSQPLASFGKEARVAALQWEYPPLIRNGQATPFIVQQSLSFKTENIKSAIFRPIPASWK